MRRVVACPPCWLLLPPLKADGRCWPGCKEQEKEAESDVVVVVVWVGVGRESKRKEACMKTSDERSNTTRSRGFLRKSMPCLGAFTHVALPSWPSDSPRFVCHTLLLVLIFIFMSSNAQSPPQAKGLGDHRRTSSPSGHRKH